MYSRKLQELDCPVLNLNIVLEIVYEVCSTGSCQILSNLLSVSCSQEGACDRASSEECPMKSDYLKSYTI